jgi:hypothetical protein
LGVSRQGEFKNTTKIFLQQVHVGKKIKNFDKIFDVSFSSAFFVLSRFRVFFCDGSSKTQQIHNKQDRVEKFFTKNSDQKSKTDFLSILESRIFFNHLSRFWAFLDAGSSKTRQKNTKKQI